MSGGRFPRLVAFDLDYTLWDLWIDTHVSGPLRRPEKAINKVLDRDGEVISFYKDVPCILQTLHQRGRVADGEEEKTVIAACSRTHAPDLARRCLGLLLMPSLTKEATLQPAIELFDELEIYPGSKLKHFRALHERTGIPYNEMLFFDDERRNIEVEKLGVTFVLVPSGVNQKSFQQGLSEWRRRRSEDDS
ncbi:magnesium-dependent phosphatase-1 [Crepidotus variabilis]|uniref:Magnesium-dependent phosphatase-1 n=1 Tax=Crepidotus variabilis TaxID=179855 RepID=A0A9P6JRH4_9AGAR|nr:magnesium-dependent phosphatase-1 [Crepidotus variabilis]